MRRENERLDRQIEILTNRLHQKVVSCALVREGWLDKRSERYHGANVRTVVSLFLPSPDSFVAVEESCNELEDVAASVRWPPRPPNLCNANLVYRWFQLFTDRLVRESRALLTLRCSAHFCVGLLRE